VHFRGSSAIFPLVTLSSYGYRQQHVEIPIKSSEISVRFAKGWPKLLTRQAAKSGQRRATWMRAMVLQRAEQVLGAHAVLPLTQAPAFGQGEVLVIRLTAKDLKLLHRAAHKEGMFPSTYVRAVCMHHLEGVR